MDLFEDEDGGIYFEIDGLMELENTIEDEVDNTIELLNVSIAASASSHDSDVEYVERYYRDDRDDEYFLNLLNGANRIMDDDEVRENQEQEPAPLGICIVCRENLNLDTVYSTVCGHLYCGMCILSILVNEVSRCALCQRFISNADVHRVFFQTR